MDKTVELFQESLVGIRGSTVSMGLIDSVRISIYGTQLPVKSLAHTGKQENSIWVDPFDVSTLGAILSGLRNSGFSVFQFSKQRIMVSVPPITGEERQKIIKHLQKLAEDARISVRNIRKNHRNSLAPEDLKSQEKSIQAQTDECIRRINESLSNKIESFVG